MNYGAFIMTANGCINIAVGGLCLLLSILGSAPVGVGGFGLLGIAFGAFCIWRADQREDNND